MPVPMITLRLKLAVYWWVRAVLVLTMITSRTLTTYALKRLTNVPNTRSKLSRTINSEKVPPPNLSSTINFPINV